MNSFTESERDLQPDSSHRIVVKRETNKKMKKMLEEEKKEGEEMTLSEEVPSDEDFHPGDHV